MQYPKLTLRLYTRDTALGIPRAYSTNEVEETGQYSLLECHKDSGPRKFRVGILRAYEVPGNVGE
jgi:hypothetical protein